MTVAPLQLPVWKDLPQLNFKPLDEAGDAIMQYRQRSTLADSLPSMLGQPDQGNGLNALGQNPVPPANIPNAPAAPSGAGLTQDQMALLKQSGQKYGIDPNYLITVASKEGTGQNPKSSANGLGQFTAETAKQYGVVPGDAASAADGFARFTMDNAKALSQTLGRTPTPDELALAHQQGAGGATALLSNPNANVVDALTPAYKGNRALATQAVVNNGGDPNMTAGQFAQKQMAYYSGGQNAQLPPNAQPAQYQPQAQPGQPGPGSPPQSQIPPQVMERIQAMIRAGGPAQQFAMALLQKYVVPQTPVVVNEGGVAFNPVTGAVIARGQPKPVSIPLGGSVGTVQSDGTIKTLAGSNAGTLDAKTLDGLAQRYLQTGDNQIITDVGNGTLGSVNKAALLHRVEELRAQGGKSGTDIVGAKGDSQAQIQATKDFATGTQGNTVRSLNVAVDHLALLRNLAQAQQNGDIRAINSLRNLFRTEFGSDLPTNVDAAKHIVAAEITKAVTGSNGALGDREELTAPLQTANSWEQLSGVIDKAYTPLMAGQLKGLRQQYVTSTKSDPSKFDAMLSDRTRAALNPAPAPGPQGSATPQAMPKITDRNQANLAIAAARKAIASHKDPVSVNNALKQMGIPPLAGN